MSFILDALKKSERERQRHREPTLADIPFGRAKPSQAVWMGLVVALLLVNLGVLVYVLWPKSATPSNPPPATAPAAASTAAPVAPAASKPSPSPAPASPAEVRSLSAEAQSAKEPEEESLEPAGENSPASSEPKLVRAIAAPPAAAARSATADVSNAPTLSSLGGAGAMNLPELHLDIHVYSAMPAERFVFINMRKYTEGQALAEGPTVQRIASDGVVLEYRNQRFLLSKQ